MLDLYAVVFMYVAFKCELKETNVIKEHHVLP